METAANVHPNKRHFIEGLNLIFERWVAFRMALEMEWGGPDTADKAVQFKEGLVDYFDREGRNIEQEDIEDILLDVMCSEFCTMLEDGSEIEVSPDLKSYITYTLRKHASVIMPLNVVRSPECDTSSTSDTDDDDFVEDTSMIE